MVMMQDGFTALLTSSHMGHRGVVKALLKSSAKIDAADNVRVRGSVFGVSLSACVSITQTYKSTQKNSMCFVYLSHNTHFPHI